MTDKLTRAQLTEQVAYYKALAEQAGKRERAFRAELTAQAEKEWREGSAPTWRIAGLGTVSSSIVNDAVVVDDEAALLAWVKEHNPDEVVTREEVAAPYRNALLKNARVDEATGALVNAAGEVVPGIKLVAGGQFKGISFLFGDDTKAAYAQAAEEALSRVALRITDTTAGDQPAASSSSDGEDALAAFAALSA
jgi:hypothetical protein